MVGRAALLIVNDHLRRRAAHLQLRAHPLQARSQLLNLLLLPRGIHLEVPFLLRQFTFRNSLSNIAFTALLPYVRSFP
jgi:hypothetical protein